MKTSRRSRAQSNANLSGRRPQRSANPRDLRRTLSRSLLARAREIGDQYSIVVEPSSRGYEATSLEMPTVFVHASTEAACLEKMREALMVGVAVMLDAGQEPPAPMAERQRTMQINVRLTPREKLLLESASRRLGFRGVSDFVRNAALAQTRKIA